MLCRECPNGKECQYRHALPQGYVFKSVKKAQDEQEDDKPTVEQLIEEDRKKLTGGGTPVTLERFLAWKEAKRKKREKEEKKSKNSKKKAFAKVVSSYASAP